MAWTLGRIFGIPVRLHITMVLVPFLTFNWMPIRGALGFAVWASLVVLLFGSVLLHELGHALTARRFGVHTQDIVLTPIGGMARVAGMPSNPRQEIAIAVAGPLVSLMLAGLAFVSIIPLSLVPVLPGVVYEAALLLFWINLMLGLFNLVPALPMDGGRVLRGILALKRDHLTATILAARVGRILAVVGVAVALVDGNFTLGLIAVFVYLAAGSEVRMAQMRAYQERMQGSPFAEGAAGPFGQRPGRVWTWSRTSRGHFGFVKRGRPDPGPDPYAPEAPESREGWREPGLDESRDVVVVGGKARVIGRKDPESDE